jgi:hypothetical protein
VIGDLEGELSDSKQKKHAKSHEGQGHRCAPAAPVEPANMIRCTMHEQKRILGFLFQHCISNNIHDKTKGEELYELITGTYKIAIPKGATARASKNATVSDYRKPPTLSGIEDEKLLLCFGELMQFVLPSTSNNDDLVRDAKVALKAYGDWTDVVGERVEGQWPSKADLAAKKDAVDKAAAVLYTTVTTVSKKPIPYLHDVACHNDKYAEKDCHTRSAEGEEGKNKINKNLGRGNSNGKEIHTCRTIMRTNAVQEHMATCLHAAAAR